MNKNKKENGKVKNIFHRHGRKALLAVLIVLLIAGVYFLNAIVGEAGKRTSLSVDLTANAAYDISPGTKKMLGSLDSDVNIYVLSKPNVFSVSPYFLQAQHIMEEYPKYSSHINLQYIDYASNPNFAKQFPDLSIQQYDILVVCGGRVKQLHVNELFNYSPDADNNLVIVACRAEEALTAAIVNVTSDRQLHVAVLTGSGVSEMTPFTDLLTNNNYVVSNVNIATDPLDNTYDIALLLAPQVDLPEDALNKISDFLYNGGQYGKLLMYTADATHGALPNINTFLKEWGIAVGDGVVFETVTNRTYQNNGFFPVADYKDTSFQNMLLDPSMPMLMPVSHPIEQLYKFKDNYTNDVLLEFSASSGVAPADAGSDFTPDKAIQQGPMPAMILCTKNIYDNGMVKYRSEVLVASSTKMLDTFCIQNTSLSNSNYLLNIFSTEFELKSAVNVQPKSLAGLTLSVTTEEANTIGALLFAVIPLAILIFGVGVWLVRRYK